MLVNCYGGGDHIKLQRERERERFHSKFSMLIKLCVHMYKDITCSYNRRANIYAYNVTDVIKLFKGLIFIFFNFSLEGYTPLCLLW